MLPRFGEFSASTCLQHSRNLGPVDKPIIVTAATVENPKTRVFPVSTVSAYVLPHHVVRECQEESHGEEQKQKYFWGDRPQNMDSSELSPWSPGPTAAAGPCGAAVVVEGREVAPLAVQEGADGAVELDLEALVLLVVELQGKWRYARIEEVLRIARHQD